MEPTGVMPKHPSEVSVELYAGPLDGLWLIMPRDLIENASQLDFIRPATPLAVERLRAKLKDDCPTHPHAEHTYSHRKQLSASHYRLHFHSSTFV